MCGIDFEGCLLPDLWYRVLRGCRGGLEAIVEVVEHAFEGFVDLHVVVVGGFVDGFEVFVAFVVFVEAGGVPGSFGYALHRFHLSVGEPDSHYRGYAA